MAERLGFIEDDDGLVVGYQARGILVYEDKNLIGFVEDDVAYEHTVSGPRQIGTVYWSEQIEKKRNQR
jgi:hypothetical protein